MSLGDRWQLPDGRQAIETGRSTRLLRVIPILSVQPHMGLPELVWRGECTPMPSRYLHGELPAQASADPAAPDLTAADADLHMVGHLTGALPRG